MARFDMKMLEALPQHSFTTRTPWYDKPVKFTGLLLLDVLAAVKASDTALSAVAISDQKVSIPITDASQQPVIVARLLDDVATNPVDSIMWQAHQLERELSRLYQAVHEAQLNPETAGRYEVFLSRCGLLEEPENSVPGPNVQRLSGPFPLSSCEMPVRLPEAGEPLAAVIDTESCAKVRSMMPEDSLGEMLDTLFAPPEGTVRVLLQALHDQDRAAVGYNAHKLKGTAMLTGFKALTAISTQIEYLATRTGDPLTAELGPQLLRAVERAQNALRQYELGQKSPALSGH